jgi:hypothetical protein
MLVLWKIDLPLCLWVAYNFGLNMKTLTTCILVLICVSLTAFAEPKWTHQVEVGEDASSTHYYFYESDGESIERIRWVWNGGAQNLPKITDYLFESGKITVRHQVGTRDDVKALIEGRDADLKVEKEYSLSTKSSESMLLPTTGDKSLSDSQRVDLKNLLDLMAKERKPYIKPQDVPSKP